MYSEAYTYAFQNHINLNMFLFRFYLKNNTKQYHTYIASIVSTKRCLLINSLQHCQNFKFLYIYREENNYYNWQTKHEEEITGMIYNNMQYGEKVKYVGCTERFEIRQY